MAEKSNHKGMAGLELGPGVFERLLLLNGLEAGFDPKTQGGLLRKNGLPVAYVRSPFWRQQENDPGLHRPDIRPVFPCERRDLASSVDSGAELEMYVWKLEQGDVFEVLAGGSPVPDELKAVNNGTHFEPEDALFEVLHPDAKQIGYSAELANGCIEINFHHSPDPVQTALAIAHSLKKLAGVIEKHRANLIPIAAFSHRPLELSDTSTDPYVNRIATEYMGWENVRHFVGASWQVHVEMVDLESALPAVNLYQQVSPLLYALSLASPFVHGETNPNLARIYAADESNPKRLADAATYGELDDDNWLSVRQAARWRGSPSGGVFEKPLPESRSEFFAQAESGLKDNDPHSEYNIPSPARAAGHHRDRVRVDIGPNGTLEISNMDTFGGHALKLAASQEFTRALVWKLQYYAKTGRLMELSSRYPDLFSYPVTEGSLRNAHFASLAVAKKGMDAEIDTVGNNKLSARQLFGQLLEFVNEPENDSSVGVEYYGLPAGITAELVKSSLTPQEQHYAVYRDTNGIVSARGFYDSGVGTLAHWLKKRASELMENSGFSQEEAIRDCLADLGYSYHQHLHTLNGQLKALFL